MNKYLTVGLIFVIFLLLAGAVYILFFYHKNTATAPAPTLATTSTNQNQTTTPPPATQIKPSPTLVYPIDRFLERITVNKFGTYYPNGGTTSPDIKVCPNAKYYSGYHTADDLETFADELNSAVPVYAISDATVKQIGPVTGYGGLIVLEATINNQTYTIYYGHVNLASTTLKTGESLTAGQKIAELGAQCSSENGDVRKHLHFGVHEGTSINEQGYVPNQSDLSDWIDPKTLF